MLKKRQSLLRSARKRAKLKGLDFNLTLDDIIIPEYCPILGLKINLYNKIMSYDSPSIDRIDPKKGYIKENIHIVSIRANRIKSNADSKLMFQIYNYMVKYEKI